MSARNYHAATQLAAGKRHEAPTGARSLFSLSFLPAVSNFSIQYNYACASIAVAVMLSHDDARSSGLRADFPEPRWAQDVLLSVVFVGSALGMLVMGYLGDLMGNRPATILTNVLVVAGALGSALLSWGGPDQVWGAIAAGRFCLGVGVGGLYPLSAARAAAAAEGEVGAAPAAAAEAEVPAESAAPPATKVGAAPEAEEAEVPAESATLTKADAAASAGATTPSREQTEAADSKLAGQRAAAAFCWQGPGACAPYILALLLLQLPHQHGVTSLQFRALLAAGALPAGLVLHAALHERPQGPLGGIARQLLDTPERQAAMRDPRHWRVLVGTAGTWFLFDVAFYGTAMFQPVILAKVFSEAQSLEALAGHALLMSAVGGVGIVAGLYALQHVDARTLNTVGLAASGALFLVLMVLFQVWPQASASLFGVLCLLFFALEFGPGVATFILPVAAFPAEVRSTFHGMSAAAAKVGAMVGAACFPLVNEAYGIPAVMATQAAICFAAAVLSHVCLPGAGEVGKGGSDKVR